MSLSYVACASCGDNYYFHVVTKEMRPSLGSNTAGPRKRNYQEAMGGGRMEIDQIAKP